MKKIFKYFLFSIFYFLFILICLELLVGVTNISPPLPTKFKEPESSDILPWIPEPNSYTEGWSMYHEYYKVRQNNSLGFRDTEHDVIKPVNVFRILGVGDSMTYGVGAKFNETYLYRLEEMLNNRPGNHPRVEILKMGVERYWAEPERLVVEHYGMKYDPDLVIVGFTPNDIHDTAIGITGLSVTGGYLTHHKSNRMNESNIFSWLLVNSKLYRLGYSISKSLKPKPNLYSIGNPMHYPQWKILLYEYEKMSNLAKSNGAKFAILNIPQWSKTNWARGKFLGLCKDIGCTLIDAHEELHKQKDVPSFYHKIDGHFKPKGYNFLAKTMFDKLVSEGLVP